MGTGATNDGLTGVTANTSMSDDDDAVHALTVNDQTANELVSEGDGAGTLKVEMTDIGNEPRQHVKDAAARESVTMVDDSQMVAIQAITDDLMDHIEDLTID